MLTRRKVETAFAVVLSYSLMAKTSILFTKNLTLFWFPEPLDKALSLQVQYNPLRQLGPKVQKLQGEYCKIR